MRNVHSYYCKNYLWFGENVRHINRHRRSSLKENPEHLGMEWNGTASNSAYDSSSDLLSCPVPDRKLLGPENKIKLTQKGAVIYSRNSIGPKI